MCSLYNIVCKIFDIKLFLYKVRLFVACVVEICIKYPFFYLLKEKYSFLWIFIHLPSQAEVLVAACGILSCGMWDLVPWPGIIPMPPALGMPSLSHWTIREARSPFSWVQLPQGFHVWGFLSLLTSSLIILYSLGYLSTKLCSWTFLKRVFEFTLALEIGKPNCLSEFVSHPLL